MYELALVHALGLPFMLISSTMDPAPFYVAHDRVRHAAYDKLEATAAELHGPFAAYLDPKNRQNFADNAVRYQATLRFINGNVRTMLSAIKGE